MTRRDLMISLAILALVAGRHTEAADPVSRVAGRALAEWQSELDSSVRTRRLRAILTLPVFGDAAVQPLGAALGHADPAVRYWAASGLGDLAHKASRTREIHGALQQMLKHKSVGLQISAAYALCRLGHMKQGLPVLTRALEHSQRGVACSAADFLARIGPPAAAAVGPLQQAVRHKDYHVKGAALEALRQIRTARQEEK